MVVLALASSFMVPVLSWYSCSIPEVLKLIIISIASHHVSSRICVHALSFFLFIYLFFALIGIHSNISLSFWRFKNNVHAYKLGMVYLAL
jgi:hypothetical protein